MFFVGKFMSVESPTAITQDAASFVVRPTGQTEEQRVIPVSLQALLKISTLSPSFQEPLTRNRLRAIIECCDSPNDLTQRLVEELGAGGALELKELANRIEESTNLGAVLTGIPELAVRRIKKWGGRDLEELRVRAAQEEEERKAKEQEEKHHDKEIRLELHKASQEPWAKRSEIAGKPIGKDSHKMRVNASGMRRKLKRHKGSRAF